MSRLPRDISGDELIRRLARIGCQTIRQLGSHVKVRCPRGGTAIVPRHKRLKTGTLDAILRQLAEQCGIPKEELRRSLFDS